MSNWALQRTFLQLQTQWVTLIGETYLDAKQQTREYYRVSKADSVVVLPVLGAGILTAAPQYRPGVQRSTVDFPGGRVQQDGGLRTDALRVLQAELGVRASMVQSLRVLDARGWPVNSSFSNQKLFGCVAVLDDAATLANGHAEAGHYTLDQQGLQALSSVLDCMQCRTVLFHYLLATGQADCFADKAALVEI